MPKKQKRAYHRGHRDEKHTKRFVKTYAPYLPLMFIVGFGLFISLTSNIHKPRSGDVLAYATQMTDAGLLNATNDARQENNLEPIEFNEILDKAAQEKAEDMAKRDYWSHNTPDGQEPWVFVDNAGYSYLKAAENLAYGFETSKTAVIGWMNSPSHRANILDPDLQEVGFGVVNVPNYQGKGPETLVVAMYGLPTPDPTNDAPIVASGTNDSGISIPPPSTLAATNTPAADSKRVSYAQMLTGGYAPWISLAIGIGIGLMIMYLVLKHTRNIVRTIKNGERFILHHPLLDTTIVALLALATILAQTAGNIQ